jgi:hypothetical protein
MGFMWGTMFGVCLVTGVMMHPAMFIAAILPLAGNYLHKSVV